MRGIVLFGQSFGKKLYPGEFVVGAAKILSEKYTLTKGFGGVIEGTMPVGGLSSSAAVILTYLRGSVR